eukprot:2212775-Rhodomonas_salina.1
MAHVSTHLGQTLSRGPRRVWGRIWPLSGHARMWLTSGAGSQAVGGGAGHPARQPQRRERDGVHR